jgi:hypothetical protein
VISGRNASISALLVGATVGQMVQELTVKKY